MASAAEQLTGITVGGRVPRGLAISTVTMNDQLSYLAIDPEEDPEPSYPVDSKLIDQAAGFQFRDNVADVPPDIVTNASLRASWATLADFSGNIPALEAVGSRCNAASSRATAATARVVRDAVWIRSRDSGHCG